MDEQILTSGRDTLLVAGPFVLVLLVTLFRLDQLITMPKGFMKRQRPPSGVDGLGEPILRNPDRRTSGARRRNHRN